MPSYSGIWSLSQQFQARGQNFWPTPPGAPTIGTATGGNAAASVAFTAPVDTGIPAGITGYRVTSSPGAITATGASSPISVTGLTNGTSYTFTAAAQNATGYGPESAASNSVTPALPNYYIATQVGYSNVNGMQSNMAYDSDNNKLYFAANLYTGPIRYSFSRISNTDWTQEFSTGPVYSSGSVNYVAYFKNPRYVSSQSQVYALGTIQTSPVLIKYTLANPPVMTSIKQYTVSGLGNSNDISFMTADASGNAYFVGSGVTYSYCGCCYNPYSIPVVIKVNANNTVAWAVGPNTVYSGNNYTATAGAVDSSGNVYVAGKSDTVSSGNKGLLVSKFNSSGTLQWNKIVRALNPYAGEVQSVQVDSSGNVYLLAYYNDAAYYRMITIKLDSSGAYLWGRSFQFGTYTFGNSMRIASDGSVYVFGRGDGTTGGVNDWVLLKYNSSGTIQWQRKLTNGSSISMAQQYPDANMTIDNDGSIIIGGYVDGRAVLMKVPPDGTKTGTYTSNSIAYTYAASSGTDSAFSNNGVIAFTTFTYTSGTTSITTGDPYTFSSTGATLSKTTL
jgi:hypothetical protein